MDGQNQQTDDLISSIKGWTTNENDGAGKERAFGGKGQLSFTQRVQQKHFQFCGAVHLTKKVVKEDNMHSWKTHRRERNIAWSYYVELRHGIGLLMTLLIGTSGPGNLDKACQQPRIRTFVLT